MSESWTVVQATSQRIDLERGLERKVVRRPKDPAALRIFTTIRPGETIDDLTLQTFLGVKG